MANSRGPGQPTSAMDDPGSGHRLTAFCSYAHADERFRKALENHLATLRRDYQLTIWYDRQISPGADVGREISDRLATSDIVLLLISPDFLNSDYCYRTEMQCAIDRHFNGSARVIPIILRPCDWKRTPIGRLSALPKDGRPVISWSRRDDALLDVAEGIRRAVEELSIQTAAPRIYVRGALTIPAKRRKA